jgi:hypothetical protein
MGAVSVLKRKKKKRVLYFCPFEAVIIAEQT